MLNRDLYNSQCLPLHIAVLVELRKANSEFRVRLMNNSVNNTHVFPDDRLLFCFAALFYLAHKLVDLYPNKAVSSVSKFSFPPPRLSLSDSSGMNSP